MKHLIALTLALFTAFGVGAQSWNAAKGIGNYGNEYLIEGSGVANYTIANVRSNYIWWASGVGTVGSGAPRVNAEFMTDMTRAVLDVLIPTNSYTLTNTGAAGTNVFCISSTNGVGNGDLLLLRNHATDSYQLIVNSNNSTFTLVTHTAATNGYAVGDTLYKLALIKQINPKWSVEADNWGTNGVAITKTNFYVSPTIHGKVGVPLVLGMFATNHAGAWLNVSGDYYVRPYR